MIANPNELVRRLHENAGMETNMNKASISLLTMATLVIAAIAAKILAAAKAEAPEGYEDATGFHLGHRKLDK
jgi:hypothetical protein